MRSTLPAIPLEFYSLSQAGTRMTAKEGKMWGQRQIWHKMVLPKDVDLTCTQHPKHAEAQLQSLSWLQVAHFLFPSEPFLDVLQGCSVCWLSFAVWKNQSHQLCTRALF